MCGVFGARSDACLLRVHQCLGASSARTRSARPTPTGVVVALFPRGPRSPQGRAEQAAASLRVDSHPRALRALHQLAG